MYIIKNGLIVSSTNTFEADIKINNEKIVEIGENLIDENAEIINAEGKYVFPGGIDAHTHFAFPFGGTVSSDNFENGTKAAACGGITTVIDFAIQSKAQSLADTIKKRKLEADNNVYIDYSLHIAITDFNDDITGEIINVIKEGYPSFKLFMTYDFAVDDFTLFSMLKKVSENGGLISVHAENSNLVKMNTKKFIENGLASPMYHEASRPDYVESEAISRASIWAEETNSPIYIVHLSSAKGLKKIQEARQRGVNVIAETCPQYLILSKEKYHEENFGGAKYVISPPLRGKESNEALWQGLDNNEIEIVASDHCPFTLKDKQLGIDRFDKIPNGIPGTETLMIILYSEGVLKNKITLNKMVEVLASNPAKIFGLNNKGLIEVGKDADIVIFDPSRKKILSNKTLNSKNDYSPFEGIEITGVPALTMSRGKVIYKDQMFIGQKGWGKFQERKILSNKVLNLK